MRGVDAQLAGAACGTCPARLGHCVPPKPATDPKAARLAIVADLPSRSEVLAGEWLAGGAGRTTQRGLKAIGVNPPDVHLTGAILCECADDDQLSARKACAPRLAAELAGTGAPIVVPFGGTALQSVLGRPKKLQLLGKRAWRGSVTRHKNVSHDGAGLDGFLVCPTLHPSFIFKAPKWAPVLEGDFERIGRLLRDPEGWRPPEEVDHIWDVLHEPRELAALDLLGPIVAFDVETVGLGPMVTNLVCFALSDGAQSFVVPWTTRTDGREAWWKDPHAVAGIVTRCLRKRTMVTHNGPAFDHVVAHRVGIRWGEWEDTLLETHALRSHMPKGLNHLVSTTLDAPAWKEVPHADCIEDLWKYNMQDVCYTIRSHKELSRELRRESRNKEIKEQRNE